MDNDTRQQHTPGPAGTLLLRLAGPLQSWGLTGQFSARDTHTQPTKSGVIGMIAACLGRQRGDDITDLTALTMGVRVDQPGTLLCDYHTISRTDGNTLPTASGKAKKDLTALTDRWYLADAVFLVSLTGNDKTLEAITGAIDNPVYAPVLGRRSCSPTGRLNLGVHSRGPVTLFADWPWQAGSTELGQRHKTPPLDATVEDPHGEDLIPDVPSNYAPLQRGFGNRRIRHLTVQPPHPNPKQAAKDQHTHDPFDLLRP